VSGTGPEVGTGIENGPGRAVLSRAMLAGLARLPQGAMSRAFGRLADVHIPQPLRRAVLGAFVRFTGIDTSEAERPIESYATLDQFFVRRLRQGTRTWPASAAVAASPVDGIVGQSGAIRGGDLLQAKGRIYSAASLLEDPELAGRYEGGEFLTIYLSPRHYHRIHTPTEGRVVEARHVPGALLPVNAAAVRHVASLFVTNERLICHVEGTLGRVAVVAVGAYNVGRISAAFDPDWNTGAGSGAVTNRRGAAGERREYSPGVPVSRGEEIMAFHLGSTVVLLFEPDRVVLSGELRHGTEIRLGTPIASAR
jgi:phosphatidylserine decarboxylase